MAALDSAELTWTVEKKNAKGKKVTVQQTRYQGLLDQAVSITLCIKEKPEKPELEVEMGILPIIQDVRSNDQIPILFGDQKSHKPLVIESD